MNSIASWSPSQSEPFDGVVEVVVPVVFRHVAERRADAALRRDGVRARREHLGQHRDVEARARELQRGAHAGSAGADDHDVEPAPGELAAVIKVSREPGPPIPMQPTSQTSVRHVEAPAAPDRLDVVHQDVAHPDPGVVRQRDEDGEGERLHPLAAKMPAQS